MEKNTDIDLSKCTLIKSEINDYISIDEFEKDPLIRSKKYPYVTHIKIEKYIYKKSNGKNVTKTVTTKKMKGIKSAIDRRYRMKPFGTAKVTSDNPNPNDGVTTIGAEVFIENPKTFNNNSSSIFKTKVKKKTPSFSSVMKAFRPSLKNLEKFKDFKDFKETNSSQNMGFTKTFVPSKLKKKMKENMGLEKFSIVIKNIPSEYDIRDIEFKLRNMFRSFGEIERLKVLSDKNDRTLSRDIAFLDFIYPNDAINLLKSSERFIIEHNILNLEKSKSTK
jgi:hypothetical protein